MGLASVFSGVFYRAVGALGAVFALESDNVYFVCSKVGGDFFCAFLWDDLTKTILAI